MADPGAHAPKRELLLLVLMCPLLLAGCIGAPFLNFDDDFYLTSAVVNGTAPWTGAFDDSKMNGSNFPLPLLSFRFEHAFYHDLLGIQKWAPFARIDNLLLHG